MMTQHRSFKRIVRARMAKTGESYTAARSRILAAEETRGDEETVMPQGDSTLRERTGQGWEHWLAVLDDWGALDRSHTEIARHLRENLDVDGWWAQTITVGYERARGRRAVGENAQGFTAGASRTVNVSVEALYDAFMEESRRERWLGDAELEVRTATRPKGARFNWGGGPTRVIVGFEAKGETKSVVALSHERLGDAAEAERLKGVWRSALTALKTQLER